MIANYLNEGKVIGHFSGRTEFGPRALGARSIIGDPRNKEMQTTINLKIKSRESFRPFAPTVLIEKVNDYFELKTKSPYMMLVSSVQENRRLKFDQKNTDDMLKIVRQLRSDIPAVTHVDYSSRIQTIEKDDHKKFYDLIKAFDTLTGYGVIINTSFNIRGEPIVNSPMDAFRCFMNTEMDVLFLENNFILKSEQSKIKGYDILSDYSNTVVNNNNDKYLLNKLNKIYQNDFISLSKKVTESSKYKKKARTTYWLNCSNQNDIEKIFSIPNELDTLDPNPQKMAKSITKFWHNASFGKIFEPVLVNLLSLSKKYPLEEDINPEISDKIYEMF